MPNFLTATDSVSLPHLPPGWLAWRYAVLLDGTLGILADDPQLGFLRRGDDHEAHWAEYVRRTSIARIRLFTFDGQTLETVFETALEERFPIFDRLTDGRWFIADRRTAHGPNTRILTSDGTLVARIMLGDGIGWAKSDAQGRVWVGWFDEGIFGNDQWKIPGREWPPSSSGIACFTETGALLWEHKDDGTTDGIADCYALNVAGDAAWACTYVDYPITRLSSGAPARRWTTDLSGVRALAVADNHVLTAGAYRPDKNSIVLLTLDGPHAVELARWTFDDTVESESLAGLIDARGSALHRVWAGQWQRWDVADITRRNR